MGESFVQAYPVLRWATGELGLAQENMPVVLGFKAKMEMPTLIICDVVCCRLIEDRESVDGIADMVDVWREKAP